MYKWNDRCTNVPTDILTDNGCMNVPMDMWTDIQKYQWPSIYITTPKIYEVLFKATFLHLRNWKTLLKEPPDCTGNEPTPGIGGPEQEISNTK